MTLGTFFIKGSLNKDERKQSRSLKERPNRGMTTDQKRIDFGGSWGWSNERSSEGMVDKVQDIRIDEKDELVMLKGKAKYLRLMYTM